MAVYVDTAGWIAMGSTRDANHAAAKALRRQLGEEQATLVTGWHTLLEFADGLADRVGQKRCADAIMQLLNSPDLHVEPSEPHRERALELFTGRTDWEVDLSDCLSFALMEALGIRRAFTYDADFAKAGFEVVG